MNFFTQLDLLNVGSLHIVVKKDSTGKMTVSLCSISSVEDNTINSIPPLSLTNTPENLDKDFFSIIKAPLQQTDALISNLKSYNEKLELAKTNNGAEQEKKKKIQKNIDKIKSIETDVNFDIKKDKDKILDEITKILEVDGSNKYAKDKKSEVLKLVSTGSLFEDENE